MDNNDEMPPPQDQEPESCSSISFYLSLYWEFSSRQLTKKKKGEKKGKEEQGLHIVNGSLRISIL